MTAAQRVGRFAKEVQHFVRNRRVYAVHIAALFLPGVPVPSHRAHQVVARALDQWRDEDLRVMVEEGRRQYDRQLADLRDLRTRSQWLFTSGVALLAVIASQFPEVRDEKDVLLSLLWIITAVTSSVGLLGAAAVVVVRADLSRIDSAVLSQRAPPVLASLASDYATMLGIGENTIATRLTVFREAVLWLLLAAVLLAYFLAAL